MDWSEKGIDLRHRSICFYEDIEPSSVRFIIQAIHSMESASKTAPITLHISTDGGNAEAMFALYDVMRTSPCPIITKAMGGIASAGPLLVAVGDERYAYENSHFMIHKFRWAAPCQDGKNHTADLKQSEKMQQRWCECMETCSQGKTSAAKWKKLMSVCDYYFDAEEALKMGIIDRIL